jgi:hypothetical protein
MMQFYADTVKKMAHCHFVSGSPLRTLCLLIAGQPADVFNSENPVNSGSLYTPHQPVEVICAPFVRTYPFVHQHGLQYATLTSIIYMFF